MLVKKVVFQFYFHISSDRSGMVFAVKPHRKILPSKAVSHSEKVSRADTTFLNVGQSPSPSNLHTRTGPDPFLVKADRIRIVVASVLTFPFRRRIALFASNSLSWPTGQIQIGSLSRLRRKFIFFFSLIIYLKIPFLLFLRRPFSNRPRRVGLSFKK
jgi:hypothetical protein